MTKTRTKRSDIQSDCMDHTVKMQHCNYGFSYLNSRLGIDEILPIGQKILYNQAIIFCYSDITN